MDTEHLDILARVDERTKIILERLAVFATCESVEGVKEHITVVEKKIDGHIKGHRWNVQTVIALIASGGGLLAGLGSFIFHH
jgi:hypothetical protein